MIPARVAWVAVFGLSAMLSGCVVPLFEKATVVGPDAYTGGYLVRIEQRGPRMADGLAFGIISREMYVHDIWLPHAPSDKSTFPAQSLKVDQMMPGGKLQRVVAMAGRVTVDKQARTVVVDLRLERGAFSGNGEYRLAGR